MGFDKLLGRGSIERALKITVSEASAKAIQKVEAAGGSVRPGKMVTGESGKGVSFPQRRLNNGEEGS